MSVADNKGICQSCSHGKNLSCEAMSQVTRSLTVLLVIRVVLLNISSVTLSAINYTVEKRSFKTRNPPLYCSSFVLFFLLLF